MIQKDISDSCERGSSVYVDVPIHPSWLGGYYVKYDGKYISLHGSVEECNCYSNKAEEESHKLLIPVLLEMRDVEDWEVMWNKDIVRIVVNP